jgi:hypothetical protein
MCVVVFAWAITSTIVVGTLALLFEEVSVTLYFGDLILVIVPVCYAAASVMAFLGRK